MEREKNRHLFWYLGFLFFLGFLAFPTNNYGFLGFFGFIPYFSIFKENDERLDILIGKSCKNTFIYLIITGIIFLIYGNFSINKIYMEFAYPTLFIGSILICIFSYFYYEYFSSK